MISNYLLGLTSISQWALFMGIAVILFGWIEKKEKFVLAGQLIFLLLGFLAIWIVLTDQIPVPQTDGDHIPKEIKVLAFYKGVVIFMGFTIASVLLKLFNFRFQKVGLSVLILFAILLFFMVFNVQQMAK